MAWEAIRLIMEVWGEHRVDGDETRPLRHLRTVVLRYFRAVSRNYVNMKSEEKWHLCKLMAFEALARYYGGLADEKPQKKMKMKHTLEVSEVYEEAEKTEMAGLCLLKDLTQEKLSIGYSVNESYLWLVKNGTLEGKLEALSLLNERQNEVADALKPLQACFWETEGREKVEAEPEQSQLMD